MSKKENNLAGQLREMKRKQHKYIAKPCHYDFDHWNREKEQERQTDSGEIIKYSFWIHLTPSKYLQFLGTPGRYLHFLGTKGKYWLIKGNISVLGY